MLITKYNNKCVLTQVEYLVGCYPQLQWDVNMTAGAWLISLIEINATEEELIENCHYVVKRGYESWQVNIALIVDLILEDRKIKRRNVKVPKNENVCSLEDAEKILNEGLGKIK